MKPTNLKGGNLLFITRYIVQGKQHFNPQKHQRRLTIKQIGIRQYKKIHRSHC